MEGKERKRADDLPAGAVEQVRELLNRPRSSADFSPAARYAVSRLCDYAAQEHELREKAETRFCNCDQFELVKCSQCSHEAYAMAFYVRGGNYCPNCGAIMDGGADND